MIIDWGALAYTGISKTLTLQLITLTCQFAYSTEQTRLHETLQFAAKL